MFLAHVQGLAGGTLVWRRLRCGSSGKVLCQDGVDLTEFSLLD